MTQNNNFTQARCAGVKSSMARAHFLSRGPRPQNSSLLISRTVASFLAALVLCMGTAAHAADDSSKHFEIKAKPLADALMEFGVQSGLTVVAPTTLTSGKKATAVRGDLAPTDALGRLLKGSGLTFARASDGTIAIQAVASNGPVQASAGESILDKDLTHEPRLEEVVVTGSHIRGEAPVGSPLKVYTREDIDQSGAATLDQFSRQMPENFSDTDTIANIGSNIQSAKFSNGGGGPFAGAGFNLHGLGASATLTLLNGHRLAAANADGSFVDISQIPLSIVERIEVLPDGASAIYGADAVAGVVNIITRKDFDGAETGVRYGGATAGGAVEFTGSQLFGHSWSGGNVLLNYEYDRQNGLDASQRDYIGDQGGPYSLIPHNRRNSIFISGSQDLGTGTTISGDAIYSDRNQFSQSTLNGLAGASGPLLEGIFAGGSTRQSGFTLTVDQAMSADWHADLTGNYSRVQQSETEMQNLALPALNLNQAFSTLVTGDSDEAGLDVLANGPLAKLPGGQVKVAVGASYRWEKFFGAFDEESSGEVSHLGQPHPLQRDVTSVYAELFLPLVGQSNAMAGVRRLEISASGRYDRYTDFGAASNPKFGLLWEPVTGLDFRGTFGTSFKAPVLENLGLTVNSNTQPTADPSSPTGSTDTLFLNGGNPNLMPEKSRSFSVGFDLKPVSLPLFSFSATYFHVAFNDRIALPPVVAATYLSDPGLASFVTRNPPLAEVQAYFDSPGFGGDVAGQGPAAVKAIFDGRYANIASTRESGLDVTTGYGITTGYGLFSVSLTADRLFENSFQPAPMGPFVALLNTFGETPRFKAHGGLGWTQAGFAALLSVYYTNSYDNPLTTPTQRIGAWTTANVNISYKAGASTPFFPLRNVTIALNVQNITDKRPPYVDVPNLDGLTGSNPIPFDPANASPVGRLIGLQLTKRF
jgi:iron complex outermembrane receptor protein